MNLDENIIRIKEIIGLVTEQNFKIDAILVGGLDNRKGDKNINEQVNLLKNGFGNNKNIIGVRFNTPTSTILNFLKKYPKTPVFLFSAGCAKAGEISNSKDVDLSKIYIIEPFAKSVKTKNSVNDAVSRGVPSKNVFVGGNPSRGMGIVNGTSSSNSNSHWGALSSVGKIINNRLGLQSNLVNKELGIVDKIKKFLN